MPAGNRACERCEFYDKQSPQHGRCRRYSPEVQPGGGGARWANVQREDWCGEWRPMNQGEPDLKPVS